MSAKYNHPLNVAVIGCGNWGQNLIRVFHNIGALYAVCDRDPSKAAYFSEKYQVLAVSFEEVFSEAIDAVVIATPSTTHFEWGQKALHANKHVFIEKPLALQTRHGVILKELAQKHQKVLMVGHLLRYHPAFCTMQSLLSTGMLGALQTIRSQRTNLGKYASEQNVLWDFAPHDISQILALVGEMPIEVYATCGRFLKHTQVDCVDLILRFKSGIEAQIYISWIAPEKTRLLTVVGSEGVAILDDTKTNADKLRFAAYPTQWQDGLPHPFTLPLNPISFEDSEPLFNECTHFLNSISHLSPVLSDADEGIRVLEILEAAQRSMHTRQVISIKAKSKLVSESEKRLHEVLN